MGAGLLRVSRAGAVAWSVVQRHRILSATVVGLSLPLTRIVSDLFAVPIADTLEVKILTVLYLLALVALCWPWTSYALAVRLSLAAAIGLACVGTVNMLVRGSGEAHLALWVVPAIAFFGFVVFCAGAFAVLSGFVFVRMRYWPVYRPGYCQKCGYNLFGLEDARCPECGTPFVPNELNKDVVCAKN